jgi:anaerobic selenocysteine-containing dehydrogenase
MKYVGANPASLGAMPFILAKTLGPELGSGNLAALWGLLQTSPKDFRKNAERRGFKPGPAMMEDIYQAILDNPGGLWIGKCDTANNMAMIRTEDGRLNVHVPEMDEWVRSIEPESEAEAIELDEQYPFILMAGRHMDMNANTLMRNPAWNKDKRACTAAMNPVDAEKLNLNDGQTVRVTTEAGTVEVELEVTDSTKKGQIIIPHGFGLVYEGKVYGANVNRLTKNTYRDKFAGTPLHRYVPCRIEAV